MDYKQIGILVILLVLLIALFGCTSFQGVDENNSFNNSSSVNSSTDLVDCDSNLSCLIKEITEGKSVKATIESVYVLNGKDYVNTDYLEIRSENDSFIVYRKVMNVEFGLDGNCSFSKEDVIPFLENWNENSFNTDYYSKCQGAIYDSDYSEGELNE